jgi:hypothetical protein
LFEGITLTTLVVLMLHLRRETLSAADRASGRAAFLDVSSLNFGGALAAVFLLAPWQRIQSRPLTNDASRNRRPHTREVVDPRRNLRSVTLDPAGEVGC